MEGLFGRLLQGGGLSLIKLVCGLLKLKVMAIVLGVEGVGLFSLLLQFQGAAVALISMGNALGVINLGRPAFVDSRIAHSGRVAGTALGLVGFNSVIFAVTFFAFSDDVRNGVLEGRFGQMMIWPVAVAAISAALAGGFWEGVLFLTNRFDLYVRASVAATLTDAAIVVTATMLYGLQGAVIASMLSAGFLLIAFSTVSLFSKEPGSVAKLIRFDILLLRPLLNFSVLMLTTTALSNVTLFLARSRIVSELGPEANGLLQVPTAMAAYLLPFLTTGIHGHLFPIASAQGDIESVRAELRRTVRVCVPVASVGCMGIVLTTPVLIPILYSKAFTGAWSYVSLYFIGEFFFIIASVYGIYLMAISDKWTYFIGIFVYSLILLIGVMLGTSSFGVWAYVASHIAAASIVAGLALLNAYNRSRFDYATVRMIILNAAAVATICFIAFAEQRNGVSHWASWSVGIVMTALSIWPVSRPWLARLKP